MKTDMAKYLTKYTALAFAFVALAVMAIAPLQTAAQNRPSTSPEATQQAQANTPVDTTAPAKQAEPEEEPPIRIGTPYQPFNQSLFFTQNDIIRIRMALAGIDSDVVSDGEADKPENRVLRLSGITYSNPDQWMIWLNGMRITPYNMPPEMINVRVTEDFIDLKWFDNTLKKIIRIRLRPNQVYDISTGIMLPG
jgi:hypothetical protein